MKGKIINGLDVKRESQNKWVFCYDPLIFYEYHSPHFVEIKQFLFDTYSEITWIIYEPYKVSGR